MELIGLCHSFKSPASPPYAFGFGSPGLGHISIKYKMEEKKLYRIMGKKESDN